MGSNRAHTYLGPIDHEEASGIGVTEKHAYVAQRYPDFVGIAKVTVAVQPRSARNLICAVRSKR